MMEFKVRNVNSALSEALWYLHVAGVHEDSRNGEVIVAPEPVTTTYLSPKERVLFSNLRDANPYFHLMESLWMLAGRNDVAFPTLFNSKFGQYSDDGETFHSAYGHRWRVFFGFDQIDAIVGELTTNPESRRCVMAMWNAFDGNPPTADLLVGICGGKDLPCNTHVYFDRRDGVLNITVCNRSNDAVWGCYGANAVQFSVLQEYMATRIGCEVGVYRQFTNNLHIYIGMPRFKDLFPQVDVIDYYNITYGRSPEFAETFPLMQVEDRYWRHDLDRFLADPTGDALYSDPFFNQVAAPMAASWFDRKAKKGAGGKRAAEAIRASDWRIACQEWIARRDAAKEATNHAE